MPEPSQKRLAKDVRRVLEHPLLIPGLKTDESYSRLHDDHDGTYQGTITVSMNQVGDMWVNTDVRGGLRFRDYFGGGMSPRVHNAFKILALAIRLDNEEHPQHIPRDSL